MNLRRRLLAALPLLGGAAASTQLAGPASASAARVTQPGAAPKAERFPGDPPEHKLVYQLNLADPAYIEHILGSVGAMIGKYGDNISLVVVVFGPGIHLLARKPRRPVAAEMRERARSQARDYGVRFVACGNTMKTLHWTAKDMVEFAQVEEVGAASLMELQEQGYAYIAW